MFRRIIAILLAWNCGLAALHAAGGVTVSGAEGAVGDRVEVVVGLSTSGAQAVAAEIHIPLPEGATPVAGSCVKQASRLPGHTVSADLKGRDYVVVIFSMPLKPIPDGDGEAFRFQLDLGENPGVFDLTPTVKLSDAQGQPVAATAAGGTLTIRGARLELGATDIDFGRVPIRGTYTRQVTAANTGTAELAFAQFTTDVPGLEVTSASPTLAPGASTQLTLTYKPVDRAPQIAGRFTVLSNSVGRAPFVRVTSVPFSVNELHVGSAEGVSDTEVTIALTMNNMEPITAAEVTFTLPEGLEYVDGSLAASPRAKSMLTDASFGAGRKLRLVMFSLGNKAVSGEDGELMTFRVKLTGQSGWYYLTPEKVILSNKQGENMVSATSGGHVSITSPSMDASSTFDIGNVPLSGTDTFDYSVYNSSSVPLTIEKVAFLDDVAFCNGKFPMVVQPRSTGKIPVTIANPKFGDFATTMNVYSNDPHNRMKAVAVKGRYYSPNELTVDKSIEDGVCALSVGLKNEAEIVAMQLDVVMPDGAPALTNSSLSLLARASGHSATVASVGANRYRIIIFSFNNTPFAGNDGGVFTLSFPIEGIEGKQLRFEDIKLSNKDGVNFTTPNTEVMVENLPVAPHEVILSSSTLSLKVGESVMLTATVKPDDATDKTVVWSSSNSAVATVDANGKVTAIALGEATITASCGSVSATCAVSVVPTPAESVTLSRTQWSGKAGESVTLTATVKPDDATDKTVAWSSSNVAVATVDANGKVTAVAVGEATITATCGSVSATCAVTVVPTPASSVTLSRTQWSGKAGESVTLTATVKPDDATDKTVAWASSNSAVATVDANGKVTAVAVGEATITASCGSVSATCVVTVVPTPAESITLSQTAVTLKAAETVTLVATVSPEATTDKTVAWSSSNEAVATVDANGMVTAVAVGEATITAACGEASAECKVTVAPTAAESVTLSQSTATLKVGESVTLTATVLPDDATDKTVAWASSNEAVATVDANGQVTAVAAGQATITAACGEASAECAVTVEEATGIEGIDAEAPLGDIYTLQGVCVKCNATGADAKALAPGIYVVGGKKVRIK